MLYYFHTDDECKAFFRNNYLARARAQVDLSTVASVRVKHDVNLPGVVKESSFIPRPVYGYWFHEKILRYRYGWESSGAL